MDCTDTTTYRSPPNIHGELVHILMKTEEVYLCSTPSEWEEHNNKVTQCV